MKRFTLVSLAIALVVAALVVGTPTRTAAAVNPTIDAALFALAQATAQAAQAQAAQRAAAAAQSAEATRQAQNVKATEAALSAEATVRAMSAEATRVAQAAQATQSAMDELTRQRAMTATAQAQNAQVTRQAQEATATAQSQDARATATVQAVAVAAQATDTARLSATYATRQDRFTWGLLVVELVFVCGAAWVLWKLTGTLAAWAVKMRPQTEPTFAGILAAAIAQPAAGVVIDQAQEPEPRMPTYVTVNNDPRFVEALDRWAEKYDRDHGVNNGD